MTLHYIRQIVLFKDIMKIMKIKPVESDYHSHFVAH
jgi:hypothetical protein